MTNFAVIMIAYPIAKINLGLNIVSRLSNGYHGLETVFYPVGIRDRLEVSEAAGAGVSSVELEVEGMAIDGDIESNLVVRAYRLLASRYSLPPVSIKLSKTIPTQAGMGGGSSDGAYMLRLLNEMFALDLDDEALMKLAAGLGADCPYFIRGGAQYAEGIGEKLRPIGLDLNGYYIGVVKPAVSVSTREAFSLVSPQRPKRNCLDIVREPIETWRRLLENDFERSVFALHPELGSIKRRLYDLGAIYAAMSGSGSALFGIFRGPVGLENEFSANEGFSCFCTSL